MHRHYGSDDQPCRAADAFYTVVTREPEWDDSDRGRALHLAESERNRCRGCGNPYDVGHDKDQAFLVDHATCRACKAMADVQATDAELPQNKDKPAWARGRTYYVMPIETPEPDERTPQ